jgi:type II secretory pathway pseudopilin PulG
MKLKPGFSILELLIAGAMITVIAAGGLAAFSFYQKQVIDQSRAKAEINLEGAAGDSAYARFIDDESDIWNRIYQSENRSYASSVVLVPLFDPETSRREGNNINCVGSVSSSDLGVIELDECDGLTSIALGFLEMFNVSGRPAPVYFEGANYIATICSFDTASSPLQLNLCVDDTPNDCSIDDTENCLPTDTLTEVVFPRFAQIAGFACQFDITGTTLSLSSGESCSKTKLSSLKSLVDNSSSAFGVMTALPTNSIPFPSVGTTSSDQLCAITAVDVDAGQLTVDTGNCPNLQASVGMMFMPISSTLSTNTPLAYFIEPFSSAGGSDVTLVQASDYFSDYENDDFTQGVPPVIPVQQSDSSTLSSATNARLVNKSGKIYVQEGDVGTGEVTVRVDVIDGALDQAGRGRIYLESAASVVLSDELASDNLAVQLTGLVSEVNEALKHLKYVGDPNSFDDQRLKFSLGVEGEDLKEVTGSGAEKAFAHVNLEVYPECGCEAEGSTAVNFEIGQLDTSDNDGLRLGNGAIPAPIELTTITVVGTETPEDFYGLSRPNDQCVKPAGSNITCGDSTKQQLISAADSVVVYIYEKTGSPLDGNNKYTFMTHFDSHWKLNGGNYENNNDCGTGAHPPSRWEQLVRGLGSPGYSDLGYSAVYYNQMIADTGQPPGPDNSWQVNNRCRAKWTFRNIEDGGTNYPLIVRDDPTEYPSYDSYTGNQFSGYPAWGNAHDGLAMGLPVGSATNGLDSYNVGVGLSNPTLTLDFWQNLNKWRVRQKRTANCSLAANTDPNAWRDIWIHPEMDPDIQTNGVTGTPPTSATNITTLLNLAGYVPNDANSLADHTSADNTLKQYARDSIILKVQTAKTCPNAGIFDDD